MSCAARRTNTQEAALLAEKLVGSSDKTKDPGEMEAVK